MKAGDASKQARQRRYRLGRRSEAVAAAFLLAKGYRVLERRLRTPLGEIDLIAVRGRRLAFVEVKRRASLEEAHASITPRLAGRVRRAAALWLGRHPGYQQHDFGFDLVLVRPWHWPMHIENGL